MHLTPRAADGSGLSRQNTIIIAVSCGIGGIVLLGVLIRFIRLQLARSAQSPVPLPPVQPLAHHREHQLSKFYSTSRPGTLYNPSTIEVHPSFPSSLHGSDSYLLGTDSPSTPSRYASSLGCDTGENVSLNSSPMAAMDLNLPNPSFHGHGKNSSTISLTSSDVHDSSPTDTSSSMSHTSYGFTRSQQRSQSSHRSRPLSMTSTSTSLSKSSRTTMRSGTPHAPHNNIQIMLPAPLGPTFQPTSRLWNRTFSESESSSSNRSSVVDQWAPKTFRSEGSPVSRLPHPITSKSILYSVCVDLHTILSRQPPSFDIITTEFT